jgi:hypothetical protein
MINKLFLKKVQNVDRIVDLTFFGVLLCTYLFVLPFKQLLKNGLFDWFVISSQMTLAQSAIKNSIVPFYAEVGIQSFEWSRENFSMNLFYSKEYLSFPYLIRTPDLLLLKYFSIDFVVTLHFAIILGIGYLGFMKLSKMLNISAPARGLFALTWFFGGFYVGRFFVGHLQLTGYILIPCFFYLLLLERQMTKKIYSRFLLGAFLGFVLLIGSFHTFFQMELFILILCIFKGISLRRYLEILLYSFCAGAFVLLPAIFNSTYSAFGSDRVVGPGYGWKFNSSTQDLAIPSMNISSIDQILIFAGKHFLEVLDHYTSAIFRIDIAIRQFGWEWDLYLGPIVWVIVLLSIYLLTRNRVKLSQVYSSFEHLNVPGLLLTTMTFLLLGTSGIYHLMFWPLQHFLGLNPIDRVPYRMAIYPLFFMCISIALAYIYLVNSSKHSRVIKMISFLALAANFGLLLKHSLEWKNLLTITPPQQLFEHSNVFRPSYEILFFHPEINLYTLTVAFAFALTGLFYLLLIFLFLRAKGLNRRK